MTIIETLAALSSPIDPEGRPVDFDRVLHGSLDLLASNEDQAAIRQLFARLIRDGMPTSRAAFTLRCGELLVHQLDRHTVTEVLLPLADL